MVAQPTNQAAPCPACGAKVFFKTKPQLEQIYICNSCDATLEVVETTPIVLEWVFSEDDYDYNDELDEDYDGDEEEFEYDEEYDEEFDE